MIPAHVLGFMPLLYGSGCPVNGQSQLLPGVWQAWRVTQLYDARLDSVRLQSEQARCAEAGRLLVGINGTAGVDLKDAIAIVETFKVRVARDHDVDRLSEVPLD